MKFKNDRFEMTEEEYQEYDDNCEGLCLSCGESQSGCEPDARKYLCESCEKKMVYGVPELLIMGLVDIVEGEDE